MVLKASPFPGSPPPLCNNEKWGGDRGTLLHVMSQHIVTVLLSLHVSDVKTYIVDISMTSLPLHRVQKGTRLSPSFFVITQGECPGTRLVKRMVKEYAMFKCNWTWQYCRFHFALNFRASIPVMPDNCVHARIQILSGLSIQNLVVQG